MCFDHCAHAGLGREAFSQVPGDQRDSPGLRQAGGERGPEGGQCGAGGGAGGVGFIHMYQVIDHVHWQHQITRFFLLDHQPQHPVDFAGCCCRCQHGAGDGHFGMDAQETFKIAVAKSVMQRRPGCLHGQGWRADNVQYRHVLCGAAGNTIQGTQAHPRQRL